MPTLISRCFGPSSGWNSIDGGGEKLVQFVHLLTDFEFVNAFWDGFSMNYGDGDGEFSDPLTAADITGHEIEHGRTERHSGLIYDGESGGQNEALSDIAGYALKHYLYELYPDSMPRPTPEIGDANWIPYDGVRTGLRSMANPTSDGMSIDHYSDMYPGIDVHFSSGIMNQMFYLLAHGGPHASRPENGVDVGIGVRDALKIVDRAYSYYAHPATTFAEGREYMIRAAEELFGADSDQLGSVKQAWTAVGVLDAADAAPDADPARTAA